MTAIKKQEHQANEEIARLSEQRLQAQGAARMLEHLIGLVLRRETESRQAEEAVTSRMAALPGSNGTG